MQTADRAAWRDLYVRAPEAAAIWHPLPFLEGLVRWLRPLEGLPLVDLACGDGGQITGLPPALAAIGIDQSEQALQRARRRIPEAASARTFLTGQLEAIPLADEAAGGALLVDVLLSFLDPGPVLSEAFRILAPGAALGVTTFTPRDPLALAHAAAAGRPDWIDGFINIFYEPGDVRSLLEGAGFQVEREERRSDLELPHPGFRDETHRHDRAVLVARKPDTAH